MSLGCRAAGTALLLLMSQEPGEATSLGDTLGCELVDTQCIQCWGSNCMAHIWHEAMLDQCKQCAIVCTLQKVQMKIRLWPPGMGSWCLEPELGLF